jgi:hypothetical protein
MDIIAGILLVSITILIQYQVLLLCLIGLVVYHSFKSDLKTMWRNIISFLLSVTIVVGIPMGVIKMLYPEAGNAESEIMKEVKEWIT